MNDSFTSSSISAQMVIHLLKAENFFYASSMSENAWQESFKALPKTSFTFNNDHKSQLQ